MWIRRFVKSCHCWPEHLLLSMSTLASSLKVLDSWNSLSLPCLTYFPCCCTGPANGIPSTNTASCLRMLQSSLSDVKNVVDGSIFYHTYAILYYCIVFPVVRIVREIFSKDWTWISVTNCNTGLFIVSTKSRRCCMRTCCMYNDVHYCTIQKLNTTNECVVSVLGGISSTAHQVHSLIHQAIVHVCHHLGYAYAVVWFSWEQFGSTQRLTGAEFSK